MHKSAPRPRCPLQFVSLVSFFNRSKSSARRQRVLHANRIFGCLVPAALGFTNKITQLAVNSFFAQSELEICSGPRGRFRNFSFVKSLDQPRVFRAGDRGPDDSLRLWRDLSHVQSTVRTSSGSVIINLQLPETIAHESVPRRRIFTGVSSGKVRR
jgi:hypothetical protein